MAEAALVTDQTEREGRDEGNDVDVGEGEEEVPEPSWSKTLERQQTEGELEADEDDRQDEKGKGLQCCPSAASRLRRCGCGLVLSMLPGSPQLASLTRTNSCEPPEI